MRVKREVVIRCRSGPGVGGASAVLDSRTWAALPSGWRFACWRRCLVRAAREKGKSLLRDVRLARPGDARALKALWDRTIRWWGDFEVSMNATDALLYERFTSPVMRKPSRATELAELIEDKLEMLGRIERYLVWPVPLQRFLRV
jgi:hypothetical protein